MPLVPEATEEHKRGTVLRTNYDFQVVSRTVEALLWFVPNEIGGMTVMKPSDY